MVGSRSPQEKACSGMPCDLPAHHTRALADCNLRGHVRIGQRGTEKWPVIRLTADLRLSRREGPESRPSPKGSATVRVCRKRTAAEIADMLLNCWRASP